MELSDEELSETDTLLTRTEPSGRERAALRWVTVEPLLFLASASYTVANLLRTQYVLVRVQELHNYTVHAESLCQGRNQSENSTDHDIAARIQADAAHWLLVFNLVGSLPGFVSTIALGSLSDRFGRKVILIVSTAGSTAFAGVCTAVMAFKLPLEVFYAADIALGLTGGQTLVLALSYSYIADVTTSNKRTFRLVVIETVYLFVGLTQVGIEYSLESLGFAPTAGISAGLGVLALIYSVCPNVLIETVGRNGHQSMRDKLSGSLRGTWRLFYGEGGGGRTCRLILIYLICFTLTPLESSLQIRILYAEGEPLCWTPVIIGYYVAFSCVVALVGNIGGFKLLARWFSNHWIFQIGCLGAILAYVGTGLVKTSVLFFAVLFLAAFTGLCFPVIRSSLSKLVQTDEQGVAFSLFACVESLGTYLSSISLNVVYMATVTFYPPFVYMLIAGITFIPSVLIWIFHVLSRRASDASFNREQPT